MNDEELKQEIARLNANLIVEKRKNAISLARITDAISNLNAATARLFAAECAMKGIPEPRETRD